MRARSAIMVVAVLISLEAIPGVAAAEIVDKEPALAVTWTWALVGGAIGLVGWRFRWWAGALLAVPPAAYFAVLHFELTDSQVGPAIVAEAGHEYLFWSYGAVATFAVLHLAGLWRALRRRFVTS